MSEALSKSKEFSISTLWWLIKLRKKFVILYFVITLVLLLILSFVLPEEYETTASIYSLQEKSGGLSTFISSLTSSIPFSDIGQTNKLQIFAEILKSREIAKMVCDTLQLHSLKKFKDLPEEVLYDNIRKSFTIQLNRNGILYITSTISTGFLPSKEEKQAISKLSADITNAAIWSLEYFNNIKSNSKSRIKRKFIEKVLAIKKRELDSIDKVLEDFQKANKVLALDKQTEAVVTNAIKIGTELALAEIDYQLKQLELNPTSPVVNAYKKKVNILQDQYNRIQSGGLVTTDEFSIPLSEVPKLLRTYTNLVRDQKILEQVNLYLETQKYQEAIQEESDIPTVEVIDYAVPPLQRSAPSRTLLIILGLLISSSFLIIGLVIDSFIKGRTYIKKAQQEE